MERILAHYVPNISFDIPSLRKAVEDLQRDQREPSMSEGPTTQAEADDLDDLAIDEESFSIRAFPDNTTRECRLCTQTLGGHEPYELIICTTEYSGEFSYLNFSMKIRKKIDEWMQSSAPEVCC